MKVVYTVSHPIIHHILYFLTGWWAGSAAIYCLSLLDARNFKTLSQKISMNDWMGNGVPSVGVKEGLSCVFSRAKWCGKARNLALP